MDADLEPGDDTKDSNKSQDEYSLCWSPIYTGPSGSHHSKMNIGKSANASGDESADDTANNDIKIKGEAPIATVSS